MSTVEATWDLYANYSPRSLTLYAPAKEINPNQNTVALVCKLKTREIFLKPLGDYAIS